MSSSDAAPQSPDAAPETAVPSPPAEGQSAPPPEGPSATTGLPDEFILTPELVEEEAIRGDIVLRGAVILLAVLFGWTHITSTATLTRIRTGQELAAHGFLPPRVDAFFSYTASDRPWVNLAWLGDLLLAGLYGVGGGALLSTFAGVVAGGAFWLMGRTSVRGASTWWGSLCAGLAVMAVFPLLTPGPTLVTVAGLALTLFLLHRGVEEPQGRWWWWLVPTLLVWSNLDVRAYLGMALLGLYILGGLLAPSTASRPSVKPLLAAIAAALVNPFPLEVVRSPVSLIRGLHPLWLKFGGGDAAEYLYLARPVFDAATTAAPGWHLTAAAVLLVLTLISLVLNRRALDWGELTAVLGLNVFGLASGADFTALAVVNAVVANLNGQRWYRRSCRQEYTLDVKELLYSRAGRAVTVFALFAAAYWGVSGWMTGAAGRRIGFGFSEQLSHEIAGYQELLGKVGTDEFDDHPFHVTPAQGDLLIWLGRKSFTDSRLLVFAAAGAENLLEKQRTVTESLRSPDQPLLTPAAIATWARAWEEVLDKYAITHVVVPLETPDGYRLWVNLASQGMATDQGDVARFWLQAGISGPATVLYRLEAPAGQDREALLAFLREHGSRTVVEETFRRDDSRESPPRGVFPRGPTFYETSLLLPQPVVPNDSLVARHYATRLGAAQRSMFEIVAYCHQIIRHARRGLTENPNSAETYLLLGDAYTQLWQAESALAIGGQGQEAANRRFLQALYAYHHASQCEPESALPHALLYPLYLEHGDYDLALRHLDRVHELTGRYTLVSRDDPNYDASYQQTKRLRGSLFDAAQQGKDAVEKQRIAGLEAMVRTAMQMHCPGYALELLEADLTRTVGSLELAQNYGRLLLVNGRTLDGLQQLENQLRSVEGSPAESSAAQFLRPQVALANLGADEYARASDLWDRYGEERLQAVLQAYLQSLPAVAAPGELGDGWPIFQIMTAAQGLGQYVPDWEGAQWQQAMNDLESGRNAEAERRLEGILTSNPETGLRPQLAMYLTVLTGQTVEPLVPRASASPRPADRPPSPSLPVRP